MLLVSKCEYFLEVIQSMTTLHPEEGEKKEFSIMPRRKLQASSYYGVAILMELNDRLTA